METAFDPAEGVLRLAHGALSVLARLAVAPTDPALVDHATAPPLAELRRAGIVGPGGIHPDVRPLAEVMGAPAASLDLDLREGATPWRRCRGWLTAALLVIAVPVDGGAFDLVAERPAEAAGLLGELVGLSPASSAARGPIGPLRADELDELLLGSAHGGLPAAGGPRARWRLQLRPGPPPIEVLDGPEGTWTIDGSVAGALLRPTDAMAVRAEVQDAVRQALSGAVEG